MIALISTEDLDENNQILVKQLKNRYNDTVVNRKFILSVNRSKMKLEDFTTEDQDLLDANQNTKEESYGSGFDGKRFDEKFSVAKSDEFQKWNI